MPGALLAAYLYPRAYWPVVNDAAEAARLDPLLVLAVMRQESMFDPQAVSKNLKKKPRLKKLLPALADSLEQVEPWTTETIENALRAFADESGVKEGCAGR